MWTKELPKVSGLYFRCSVIADSPMTLVYLSYDELKDRYQIREVTNYDTQKYQLIDSFKLEGKYMWKPLMWPEAPLSNYCPSEYEYAYEEDLFND